MKVLDNFLNGYTMYRLMLYELILLFVIATILSFLKLLPFNPLNILLSTTFLIAICLLSNTIFARLLKVSTNFESVYITALILSLILTPISMFQDVLPFLAIGVVSQASKYILAINRKHLFNPAAFAAALAAIALNFSASPDSVGVSWWVGTAWMMPFVLAGGLLIIRKVRRFSMVFSFLVVSLILIGGQDIFKGNNPFLTWQKIIFDSPLVFFATVMLIEPLTTPPTKLKQILYGGLVGIGFWKIAPEIALLIGNIFSYIVSPKEKLLLKLKDKRQLTPDIYDFVFSLDKKLQFQPGQYLEWTLGHRKPDSRGNRRYFTIASSPTENDLRIGIKFYPDSSTFKKELISLQTGDKLIAGQLAGDFILPKDLSKKLVFIAGGIGITPFRSMIKYLIEKKEKRDIVLLYSNKTAADIVYREIFDKAVKEVGLKVVYINTDKDGYLDDKKIMAEVSDYKQRIFYISGPHSMVDAFVSTLKELQIPNNQIKIDFFPGYA